MLAFDTANVLRLFRDNTSGGFSNEDSAGQVARVRIYDGVLSLSAVSALGTLYKKQSISLSSSSGAQGSAVTVKGSNFGPAETVTVKYVDTVGTTYNRGTAMTTVAGTFSKNVTVPAGAVVGSGRFTATGGPSRLNASKPFTVI